MRVSRGRFFENPVGAGPFQVEKYVPGQSLTLTRNPHYYDPQRPHLDKLTYIVVTDPNQQLLQFQNKQAQMIESVPLDLAAQFGKNELYTVNPSSSVYSAFVNVTRKPGADIHFRRAVSLAIDRDTYVKSVFGGLATPATGGLSPGVEGSARCDCTYPFDLVKAKQELAKSSYNGQPVVLLVDSSSSITTRGGQVLAEMLNQAGIKTDLQPAESTVMVDRYTKLDYDLAVADVGSVSPSVGDVFGLLSSGMMQVSSDPHKVIAGSFAKLDVAPTETDRIAATKTAENWIGENLPFVPIADSARVYAVASNVHGLAVTPYLWYPADQLWVN